MLWRLRSSAVKGGCELLRLATDVGEDERREVERISEDLTLQHLVAGREEGRPARQAACK